MKACRDNFLQKCSRTARYVTLQLYAAGSIDLTRRNVWPPAEGVPAPPSKTLNYCRLFQLEAGLPCGSKESCHLAEIQPQPMPPQRQWLKIISVFGVGSGEALFVRPPRSPIQELIVFATISMGRIPGIGQASFQSTGSGHCRRRQNYFALRMTHTPNKIPVSG